MVLAQALIVRGHAAVTVTEPTEARTECYI